MRTGMDQHVGHSFDKQKTECDSTMNTDGKLNKN